MRSMRTLRASIAGAVAGCAKLRGLSTNILFSRRLAAALRPLPDAHRKHGIMMTELAEGPTHVGVRRSLTYWNPEFQNSLADPALRLFSRFRRRRARRVVRISTLPIQGRQTYRFYPCPSPSPPGTREPALPCSLFCSSAACFDYFFTEPLYSLQHCHQRPAYFLIFVAWAAIVGLFQRCSTPDRGQPSSDPRQPADQGGTAQAPRGRDFANSIWISANGLPNSKRPTMSWNLLPIPSPMTSGRHCATWLGTRSSAKTGLVVASTKEFNDLYRLF